MTEDARQRFICLHIYSDMTEHKQKVFVENVSAKLTKRGKQLGVPIRIKIKDVSIHSTCQWRIYNMDHLPCDGVYYLIFNAKW